MNVTAIEIGSGKIRFCVAEIVDNRIEKILEEQEESVNFAESAMQNNGHLNDEIFSIASEVLSKFKTRALKQKSHHIHTIATDIFRDKSKAANGHEFITHLSEKLSINIKIIDQDLEGKIGFLTIAHIVQSYTPAIPIEKLIAWDSGNSSAQLTFSNNGEFFVYRNPFGIIPIKKFIQKQRTHQGILHPVLTPISMVEIEETILFLQEKAQEITPTMGLAIRSGVVVRKYGSVNLVRVFHVNPQRELSRSELWETLQRFAGKTDAEIIKMTAKDVDPQVLMLTLLGMYALMDKLDIGSIRFAETPSGNTYGMLSPHVS